ncbi:MAG: zf-HC2 domain-containing protein [Pyrinomonadaceae bacterium]
MSSNDLREACGRTEDLVSYFYGESSEIEAKSFERHLAECAACRHEQAAFNSLRSSFESARQQAAHSFAPLTVNYTESSVSTAQTEEKRGRASGAIGARCVARVLSFGARLDAGRCGGRERRLLRARRHGRL